MAKLPVKGGKTKAVSGPRAGSPKKRGPSTRKAPNPAALKKSILGAQKGLSMLRKERERREREVAKLKAETRRREVALREVLKGASVAQKKAKSSLEDKRKAEAAVKLAHDGRERLQREADELKRTISQVDEERGRLEEKLQALKADVEAARSGAANAKMSEAMVKLLLAADPEGLERWLTIDAPLVLEYVRQAKSASFHDFYKRSLYEALLGKAYRFYACGNCKGRFHAQEKDPKCCPFCSSGAGSLGLVDVTKEASPTEPTGMSVLPSPLGP